MAKKRKEENNFSSEQLIQLSSVLAPNRAWLFYLINGNDVFKSENTNSKEIQTVTQITENKNINQETNINTDSIIEKDDLASSVMADEELSSEVLKSLNYKKIDVDYTSSERAFSKPIIVVSNIEKEILKEAIDKSLQKEIAEIELPKVEENETDSSKNENEPSSFGAWLNPHTNKLISREEKLKKIDHLIDKFVKSEPKIIPKKTEFFTPSSAAKQSLIFDENLVTESLAIIFERQGIYNKAIAAYEKLSLKYPEKRTYFATRIEKIREVIKNIKNY